MAKANFLEKIVNKTARLPEPMRTLIRSKGFGSYVPMVGSAGIRYEHISKDKVVVSIRNQRKMQNHIHQVHAAAMALLAETATGFVTAMNVPDSSIVLIKSLHVDYKKPTKGALTAIATLNEEQRTFITSTEKGELLVPVTVTDESGNAPIECQMLWAWVPKKKK